MEVKKGNVYSEIIQCTPEEFKKYREILTFTVPNAWFSKRYKKKQWDGKKRYFWDKKFPTGLIHLLEQEIDIHIRERNSRQTIEFDPNILNTKSFTGKYSFQADVIKQSLLSKRGIWHLATNSGKTLISAGLTKHLDIPTLFITHSKDLMYQTHTVFTEEIGGEIGLLGDGNEDIKKITIGMPQTMVNRLDEKWFKQYLREIQLVYVDECFPGDTFVNTEEGKKRISSLVRTQSTERVWSFNKKTEKFELKKIYNWSVKKFNGKLIKIWYSKRRNVESTPNHKYWILEGRDIVEKRADSLKVGDKSIVLPSYPNAAPPRLSKKQYQASLGMVLGDASLGKTTTLARLRFSQGENQLDYLNYKLSLFDNMYFRENLTEGISGYSDNIVYNTATQSSQDFLNLYNKIYVAGTKTIKNIIWDIDEISLAFWVMDDGCLHSNKRCSTSKCYSLSTHSFSKEENKVIIEVLKNKFNVDAKLSLDTRVNKYYLRIGVKSSKILSRLISKCVPKCMEYKLYKEDRGKLSFVVDDKIEYGIKTIKKIEEVVPRYKTVYNIAVRENHNYVVDSNVLVSNCHLATAKTWVKILQKCTGAGYRFGLSGTPLDRGEIAGITLKAYTGEVIARITNDDLIELGVSSKPVVNIITVGSYIDNDLKYPEAYQKYVVDNTVRNSIIVKIVKKQALLGKAITILVKRIQHGKILNKLLQENEVVSVFCHGGSTTEKRQKELEEFKKSGSKVLILSKIGETGLDIPNMDCLIRAGSGNSTVSTLQSIGRLLRNDGGKDIEVLFFDFNDTDNEYLRKHSKQRISDYERENFEIRRLGRIDI